MEAFTITLHMLLANNIMFNCTVPATLTQILSLSRPSRMQKSPLFAFCDMCELTWCSRGRRPL